MQRHTFLLHLAWDDKCFLLLESNFFAKDLNPEVLLKKGVGYDSGGERSPE